MDTENYPSLKDLEELMVRFFSNPDKQSFKDREVAKSILNKAHRSSYGGETRETVPYEIGMTAYRYILENGGSAQEAFEYSVKMHDKSIEWLNEIKNHPYYHSKKVVEEHDNHPQQKIMLNNGTMDKSALKSSETVNKQIRKLSKSKKLSDEHEYLKGNDVKQQKEINKLKGVTTIHTKEIDTLQEISGVGRMSNKEKAYIMYLNGVTQKDVTEELEISIATVKRWWKDFKNDTFLIPSKGRFPLYLYRVEIRDTSSVVSFFYWCFY